MEKDLWKEIINESGYDGVSIPYMVGKFYEKGFITEGDLQTSKCVNIVLSNITNFITIGNEPAILLCDQYTPYIPMIQMLKGMDRTEEEIQSIQINNPSIKNSQGDMVLYLQIDESPDITLEELAEKYWDMYSDIIKNKRFSVTSSSSLQSDGTYHIWSAFE